MVPCRGSDGRRELPFEDYGPKWYALREIDAGYLDYHLPITRRSSASLAPRVCEQTTGAPRRFALETVGGGRGASLGRARVEGRGLLRRPARVGHVTTIPEPARIDDLAAFAAANGWTYQPTAEPPALSGDMWEYATAGNVQDRIAGADWEVGRIVGGARKAKTFARTDRHHSDERVGQRAGEEHQPRLPGDPTAPAPAALRARCAEQRRHPVIAPAPTAAEAATLSRRRLRHALPPLRAERLRARCALRLHARSHGAADRRDGRPRRRGA